MFSSLLVANRGEIACRVFRTAKRLGLRTIAIYSEADADALHVGLADQAICIGPAPALQSYLDINKVIAAAQESGAQAIHPGYGFLSENANFASACAAAGITFVGPPVAAIDVMGSKMASKRMMQEAGVPILPGYHGDDQDENLLVAEAEKIGYPLLIKASAGGGGKGMRLVDDASQFLDQLHGAQREAKAAFGDDNMLLERYLTAPKHIEVQLMADTHGNVIHLFERDCSVQRRHQKVIEEAPGPTITPELRSQLGETAIMAARQVGYVGAGTVEFIAEGEEFFFMEMNTRLQVEHPVTEAVTGLDLVELQLQAAAGEVLSVQQQDVQLQGHAVEVRLYAENPSKKFLPSTGIIEHFHIGDGIRIDTGVAAGSEVSMHYDPMLAKLIAHGATREQAVAQLVQALQASEVAGVEHNMSYLLGLLQHREFEAGNYTTGIADLVHEEITPLRAVDYAAAAARALFTPGAILSAEATAAQARDPLWSAASGFRLNLPGCQQVTLRQGKKEFVVSLTGAGTEVNGELVNSPAAARVIRRGYTLYVMCAGHTEKYVELTDDISRYQKQHDGRGGVVSPMPGQVIEVSVKAGAKVKQGDVLAVVEAMKMEHKIVAPKAGTGAGSLLPGW